ncbi:MAG: hypothetical protein AAF668_12030 [Pseudomonadota bacterium]
MLLRRVMEHVQTQNWTAVALDFFIVVIGVFIGIQLGNWNEARGDRSLEKYYIQRLSEDLQSSMALNAYLDQVVDQRIEEARIVRNALDDCSDVDAGLFGNTVLSIGKNAAPQLARGVYLELLSTGNQELIRSRPLREALTDAYDYVELQEKLFDLISGDERQARVVIASRVSLRIDAPFDYDARHPASAFRFDYDTLCRDDVFLNAVDQLMTSNFDTKGRYARVRERLEKLRASLAAYTEEI